MIKPLLLLRVLLTTALSAASIAHAQPLPSTDARGQPTLAPLVNEVTPAVVNISVVTRSPMEQPEAQTLFKLADLLAHSPRRDVQFLGTSGERQVPRRTRKYVQPDVGLAMNLTTHRLVLLKAVLGSFVGQATLV